MGAQGAPTAWREVNTLTSVQRSSQPATRRHRVSARRVCAAHPPAARRRCRVRGRPLGRRRRRLACGCGRRSGATAHPARCMGGVAGRVGDMYAGSGQATKAIATCKPPLTHIVDLAAPTPHRKSELLPAPLGPVTSRLVPQGTRRDRSRTWGGAAVGGQKVHFLGGQERAGRANKPSIQGRAPALLNTPPPLTHQSGVAGGDDHCVLKHNRILARQQLARRRGQRACSWGAAAVWALLPHDGMLPRQGAGLHQPIACRRPASHPTSDSTHPSPRPP